MPIVIKHSFVSPLADSGSSTEVEPSDWNAPHGIEMGDNFVIGRGAGGTGPAEEIPCNSDGRSILNISSLAHGDIIFRGASGFQRLAAGVAGQKLTTQGVGANPTWVSNFSVTLGTAVNTTSGTFFDFTSIPAGVKRISVMFVGVSTNGTDTVTIRLGTSSGIESTGYLSAGGWTTVLNFTSGFTYSNTNAAADDRNGCVVLSNVTGNSWVAMGMLAQSNVGALSPIAGSKTLSGVLDRIRVTTTSGVNLFDAGQLNISLEF